MKLYQTATKKRPTIKKRPAAYKPQMKRFTLDVPEDLHMRIKVECAKRGVNMAEELRIILEREFPE